MGERASSHSDIAALKPRFRQISYASGVFFTLAMHRRLLTNFFLGRFHLGLGPSLHRLSPQQPHFLDNPLFDRVGLLEIFARICAAQKLSLGGVHGRCSAPSSTLPPISLSLWRG